MTEPNEPEGSTTTHGEAAPYEPPSGLTYVGGADSPTAPGPAASAPPEPIAAPRPFAGAFTVPGSAVPPTVGPTPVARDPEPEPELPALRPGDFIVHDGGKPYLVIAVFDDYIIGEGDRKEPGYVLGPADLFTHPQPRSVLYTEDEWRNPGRRQPTGR